MVMVWFVLDREISRTRCGAYVSYIPTFFPSLPLGCHTNTTIVYNDHGSQLSELTLCHYSLRLHDDLGGLLQFLQ